jgi:serine protease AprX
MTVVRNAWRRQTAIAVFLSFAFAVTGARATSGAIHAVIDSAISGRGSSRVIVQTTGDVRAARASAVRSGGIVTRDLPIVHGFAATLGARAIDELARLETVRAITLDRRVRTLDLAAPPPTLPPSVYRAVDGADRTAAAGYTGRGVTVALIDTGVADVPDLAGRIVTVTDDDTGLASSCVNFSGEAGCQDSYGHGTFVAGIIAGNGRSSAGTYKGVAPEARVLSVKLSGRDGAADVSGLLASLQWVVEHKAQYGIRALNLSIGTDSPQSYRIDPLNYAVEQVWNSGIVVVVAASNRGPDPATITKPGDDPWVVTVGAIDDNATVSGSDDSLPDFSARGPTLADALIKPDLVAPGAHMISLRAPGSAIDQAFPDYIGNGYRKGSGTSFATPQVTGAVAQLVQRDPSLTPDRIKYMLTSTAHATQASSLSIEVGSGVLNVWDAQLAGPGVANQGLVLSTGLGSIDASRGTILVETTDVLPVVLTGNTTGQMLPFNQTLFLSTWSGASWHDSQWSGASWHGASWHGASWHGASWHGASWHGASWHTADGPQDKYYGQGWIADAIYGAWE